MTRTGGVLALVIAAPVGVYSQQPPTTRALADRAFVQELTPLCAQVEEAEKAEAEILRSPSRSSVRQRLSGDEVWRLVTDPSTPYLDRMFAAQEGGSAIDTGQLITLWRTAALFAHVPAGVYPSPCVILHSSAHNPRDWADRTRFAASAIAFKPQMRTLLGRDVDFPSATVDFPLTLADRGRAPWLWQMKQALAVLAAAVRAHYAQPHLYDRMAEIAWNWQPADFYERRVRYEALKTGPRNAAWVQMMVRLALDDRPTFSDSSLALHDLYVWGADSYHLQELVHTAYIVILRDTRQPDVARNAAYQSARMWLTRYGSFSKQLKPMRSATAVLAIARWAMDRSIETSTRYSALAGAICTIVDNPPYVPDPALVRSTEAIRSNEAKFNAALSAFESWFVTERPRLEREAASERGRFEALARELNLK
jgi:hypothetical protein